MFVANFLGGPDRGSRSKEPINVRVSLIDYLVYKVFGSEMFLDGMPEQYLSDYFIGVYYYGRNQK